MMHQLFQVHILNRIYATFFCWTSYYSNSFKQIIHICFKVVQLSAKVAGPTPTTPRDLDDLLIPIVDNHGALVHLQLEDRGYGCGVGLLQCGYECARALVMPTNSLVAGSSQYWCWIEAGRDAVIFLPEGLGVPAIAVQICNIQFHGFCCPWTRRVFFQLTWMMLQLFKSACSD